MSIADDFEGSLILEKLAEINKVEDFFDAVDSDDFEGVESLLRDAQIDENEIKTVLKKMRDSDCRD